MESLRGVIVDIIFQNEESGFKICELETEDDIVVCKGTLPFLQIGEHISALGNWVHHEIYGEQFSVYSFEKEIPKDPDDIETFLASGLISGVGNATASAIVEKFGEDTYEVILNEPEKLAEVKGISHNKAMKIADAFKEHFQMSDIVSFFNKYGAGTKLAIKAYQKYGGTAVTVIEKNPYILIDDIPEVGFKTADKIGKTIGISYDDSSRVYAGVIHTLKMALQSGHVYLPYEILVDEAANVLQIDSKKVESAIDEMDILCKIKICNDDNNNKIIYLNYMFYSEEFIAKKLIEIGSYNYNIDDKNLKLCIDQFSKFSGYELDENQIAAVRQAAENGLTIITGGPGTGKTSIIRALVHFFMSCKKKCLLAAPTGRAAKRMTESCGVQAKTIHRMLEFSGDESDDDSKLIFKRNEENPLDADAVIIDEISMVDTHLMYHLLKAMPRQVQLILVGDKDQLPSVGAGNVLKDLISSEKFPVVTLSVIYRQENESLITLNAHMINKGEMPELNNKNGDFFLINRNTPNDCIDAVADLVTQRLPNTYSIDPVKDIQVIVPYKKGTSGSIAINVTLQNKLNQKEAFKKEVSFEDVTYREGDRIMQIKNNYKIKWFKKDRPEIDGEGIFNGEMGEIESINDKAREITVQFDDDRCAIYNFNELRQLEHCYAITVHKSQGSEFSYCVIPLVGNPPMLMTRNILYTAITRAKKMVVVVGTREHIRCMAQNDRQQLRFTGLRRMLETYEAD